jgi:hypothetical protein
MKKSRSWGLPLHSNHVRFSILAGMYNSAGPTSTDNIDYITFLNLEFDGVTKTTFAEHYNVDDFDVGLSRASRQHGFACRTY